MPRLFRLFTLLVMLTLTLLTVMFVSLDIGTNRCDVSVIVSSSNSEWQARTIHTYDSAQNHQPNGSLDTQEQQWRDPGVTDGALGEKLLNSNEDDVKLHMSQALWRPPESLPTENRLPSPESNHIPRYEGTVATWHGGSVQDTTSEPPHSTLATTSIESQPPGVHMVVIHRPISKLTSATESGLEKQSKTVLSQPLSQQYNEQRPSSQSFWKDPQKYVAERVMREKHATVTQEGGQSLQPLAISSQSKEQSQYPRIHTSNVASEQNRAERRQAALPSNPPPASLPTRLVTNGNRHGYVLAINYYEQQSMGSRNMFQLQCWAKSLGLSVVKPVMKDSFLRTPLNDKQQSTCLKFEDSFSLEDWNRYTQTFNYAPLVDWQTFLSKAPRSVILVQFEYASVSLVKSRQRAGEGIIHQGKEEQYKTGCTSKWPKSSELVYLKSKRFRIARSVCFNFYYGDQLTIEEFNRHLLGPLNADEVTIIMDLWRGIGTAQRIIMNDACRDVLPVQEHVLPSNRLVQTAEFYARKYLKDSPYLAILGRLEMSKITIHKKVPVVPYCLQETLHEWETFVKDSELQDTFVALDIGRYGTKGFRYKDGPTFETEVDKFLKTVYGGSMTLREWEGTFESLSHWRDAGYIALLQKVIVTRAKCILFVGGGAFQRHALNLYRKLHPDSKDQCLRVVKKCTSSAKFML